MQYLEQEAIFSVVVNDDKVLDSKFFQGRTQS